MEIRWTEAANQSLDVIFYSYKEKSEQAASRIIRDIFDSSPYRFSTDDAC